MLLLLLMLCMCHRWRCIVVVELGYIWIENESKRDMKLKLVVALFWQVFGYGIGQTIRHNHFTYLTEFLS